MVSSLEEVASAQAQFSGIIDFNLGPVGDKSTEAVSVFCRLNLWTGRPLILHLRTHLEISNLI